MNVAKNKIQRNKWPRKREHELTAMDSVSPFYRTLGNRYLKKTNRCTVISHILNDQMQNDRKKKHTGHYAKVPIKGGDIYRYVL